MEELSAAYKEQKLDAFGLYCYGLVLKESQKETLSCPHPPHTVLIESILQFPYNWSAWLDLCEVVASQDSSLEEQKILYVPCALMVDSIWVMRTIVMLGKYARQVIMLNYMELLRETQNVKIVPWANFPLVSTVARASPGKFVNQELM